MRIRGQRSEVRGQKRLLRPRKKPAVLVLAFLLSAGSVWADGRSAREAFQAGVQAHAAGDFSEAVGSFLEAASLAPAERLDPSAAKYNAGLAAYAAGDWTAAAAHFAAALQGAPLNRQAQAYYNRGNALFRLAEAPLMAMDDRMPAGPGLDSAVDSIGEAIQMYENAIALDPDDADAKANYELARLKQQELEQMQQQQQQQQDQDPEQDEDGESEPQPQEPGEQDEDGESEPQPQETPADAEPEEAPGEPEPERTDEMTREEAEALLDALREQEQSNRDRLQPFLGQPVPVEKDW